MAQTVIQVKRRGSEYFEHNGRLEKSVKLVDTLKDTADNVKRLAPLPGYWEIDSSTGLWLKYLDFINMLEKDGFDTNWIKIGQIFPILVSHKSTKIMTLVMLKYADLINEYGIIISPYAPNTKGCKKYVRKRSD